MENCNEREVKSITQTIIGDNSKSYKLIGDGVQEEKENRKQPSRQSAPNQTKMLTSDETSEGAGERPAEVIEKEESEARQAAMDKILENIKVRDICWEKVSEYILLQY